MAADNIFSNQDEFREKGHDALLELLGTGTNQLGNGVLLMFYGLRGKNEKLHSGLCVDYLCVA